MATTIKEIAELAGVSRGTVDRALNERGGVNPEIERRIKTLAKELNYKPNLMAKALANSKKGLSIGVIINSGGNSFFDKVLTGIHRASREAEGFNVNVMVEELTGYDIQQQVEKITEFMERKVNVIVITPINDRKVMSKLCEAAHKGVDIITLNNDIPGVPKLAFVGCDYIKSGKTAAELLGQISGNNARVGIVTGSEKVLGHIQRIEGFVEVINECYSGIRVVDIQECFDDDIVAYEKTKQMIEEHPEMTALYFCAAGIDGGIRAVKQAKKENDLQIISVDDMDNIKSYITEGTINFSISQQPLKQGYDSIILALQKIVEDKNSPRKHMYTQNEIKSKYNLD